MSDSELEALRKQIREVTGDRFLKVRRRGDDVLVESDGGWEWFELCRRLADGLGHRTINLRSSEYEDLEAATEDKGCGTCGHGTIIVLKGILAVTRLTTLGLAVAPELSEEG